jgi:hypothetical protein
MPTRPRLVSRREVFGVVVNLDDDSELTALAKLYPNYLALHLSGQFVTQKLQHFTYSR